MSTQQLQELEVQTLDTIEQMRATQLDPALRAATAPPGTTPTPEQIARWIQCADAVETWYNAYTSVACRLVAVGFTRLAYRLGQILNELRDQRFTPAVAPGTMTPQAPAHAPAPAPAPPTQPAAGLGVQQQLSPADAAQIRAIFAQMHADNIQTNRDLAAMFHAQDESERNVVHAENKRLVDAVHASADDFIKRINPKH